MQRIKVISASPKAKKWLAHFSTARILNIFPKAINLADEGNHLLSLVTPEIGNGPFSLVVDAEYQFSLIQESDQISYSNQELNIGNAVFILQSTQVWDSIPDWERVRRANKQKLIFRIEQHLKTISKNDGFLEVFSHENEDPRSMFFSAMKKGYDLLLNGLLSEDTEKIINGGGLLGGLGIGLTPSGDDFLLGVILGLWASKSEKEAQSIARLIWAGAAGQTNSLSREWLASAVAGEAGEPWHKLVEAFLNGREDLTDLAIEQILKIGATSGADALIGFVQQLKLEEHQ